MFVARNSGDGDGNESSFSRPGNGFVDGAVPLCRNLISDLKMASFAALWVVFYDSHRAG